MKRCLSSRQLCSQSWWCPLPGPLNDWAPTFERYDRRGVACRVMWKWAVLIPMWGSTFPPSPKPEPLPTQASQEEADISRPKFPRLLALFLSPANNKRGRSKRQKHLPISQSSSPQQPEITCSEIQILSHHSLFWKSPSAHRTQLYFLWRRITCRTLPFQLHFLSWPSMYLNIQPHKAANLPKLQHALSRSVSLLLLFLLPDGQLYPGSSSLLG